MSDHPQFPHLFRPLTIQGVTLKNRIAISAHIAGWWVDGGLPSDAFVAYVEERAKGGVGLFVIGATIPERGHAVAPSAEACVTPIALLPKHHPACSQWERPNKVCAETANCDTMGVGD